MKLKLINNLRTLNDPELYFGNSIKFFQQRAKNDLTGKNTFYFDIIENNTRIGICGLLIEYGLIGLIGVYIEEKPYAQAYGVQAVYELINYGFSKKLLHKIWVGFINENNTAAYFENNKFISEGVAREALYFNKKWVDLVYMSILEKEFFNNIKST